MVSGSSGTCTAKRSCTWRQGEGEEGGEGEGGGGGGGGGGEEVLEEGGG